jgi:uncharacterized membrane protein
LPRRADTAARAPEVATSGAQRFDAIDGLRGAAVVWMTVFHFSFVLANFGYTRQDFYLDPFWTWQRTAIVSLFLFCAGVGQGIAAAQGQTWPRFWRRWRTIVLCAALVTLGSYLMFPQSFIYFGVLHGIALMLIIVRLTMGCGRWMWLLGALAIATALAGPLALVDHPLLAHALDSRWLNWLGIVTEKPITEDYVPLLPWLGARWWGAAAAQWLMARPPQWLGRPIPELAQPLAALGRNSLIYYMLHQPVLIGLVVGYGWITR